MWHDRLPCLWILLPESLDRGPDSFDHPVDPCVLFDIFDRAKLPAGLGGLTRAVPGDEIDLGVPIIVPYFPEDIDTAHAREDQIEKHDCRVVVLVQEHSLRAVCRRDDMKSLPGQDKPKQLPLHL